MTFPKISKTQICHQKHPKTKITKIKNPYKEVSNQKVHKTNYSHNWKILGMTFLKIKKKPKNYQIHRQSKNSKNE